MQLDLWRYRDRLALVVRLAQVGSPAASGIGVVGVRRDVGRSARAVEDDDRVIAQAERPAQLEAILERREPADARTARAAQAHEPLVELLLDGPPGSVDIVPDVVDAAATRAHRHSPAEDQHCDGEIARDPEAAPHERPGVLHTDTLPVQLALKQGKPHQ